MIALEPASLSALAAQHGGEARGRSVTVARMSRLREAGPGDLAPLLHGRYVRDAEEAAARGAALLIDASLVGRPAVARLAAGVAWVHPHGSWAMAIVLDSAILPLHPPEVGPGCVLGPNVVLEPGVVLGARVVVGANSVVGRPGFGWATGPDGAVRPVRQLGGVVIEDDVVIGPLCTIDSGTLAATRIRRGAKLDAQIHVGHNCDIGQDCMIAAQCGFAGSVTLERGVLVGGQAGVADHVRIGEGARVAAKSGVIGDIPAGATVAGYPAVARGRWLRGLARLYKGLLSTPTHEDPELP